MHTWWECAIKGHPCIDTQRVDSSRHIRCDNTSFQTPNLLSSVLIDSIALPTNLSYLLFRILGHSSYDEETQVSPFNPVFRAYSAVHVVAGGNSQSGGRSASPKSFQRAGFTPERRHLTSRTSVLRAWPMTRQGCKVTIAGKCVASSITLMQLARVVRDRHA